VFYAVCTSCSFLRAYSSGAGATQDPPDGCPACGAKLVLRRRARRFPPTYVGRVSLELMSTPELEPDQPQRPGRTPPQQP
jgi:hypothetical protein